MGRRQGLTRVVPARPAGDRPPAGAIHAAGLLALGTAAALWLHLRAGMRFPPPWPDESHFMVPAWNLARDLTVRAPELAAPDGIMWVPDGWYVALAPVLAVAGLSLEAARWLSFGLTTATAMLVAAAGIRLGAGPRVAAGVAAVWLVTPHVVLMGNLARMESLLAALTAAAVVLATCDRWPAALAVASAGVLVHPVAAAVVVPLALVAAAGRVRLRPRGLEWALIALLVLAAGAEAAWMLSRWSLVSEHLGYQLRLKQSAASSGGGLGAAPFAVLAAVAAAGAVAAFAAARRRRPPQEAALVALPLAVAAGLATIRVVGVMQWYTVLSLELAGALLVIGVAAALPGVRHLLPTVERMAGRPWLPVVGMGLAAALVVAAATATLSATVFGLRMDAAAPGEWHRFARAATDAVHDLDARQTQPVRLAFSSLSGLPVALLDEDLRHVRVVALTPVSGSLVAGDLVAVSPGAAPVPAPDLRRLTDRQPVIHVRSSGGAYELIVHEVPRSTTPDGR